MIGMRVTYHENPSLQSDERKENNFKIKTDHIKAIKFIIIGWEGMNWIRSLLDRDPWCIHHTHFNICEHTDKMEKPAIKC
jgi:hypothetical protein